MVPSRTRLLLFEATPSDSLNDIGDPGRFREGTQKPQAFPPPIPTIRSRLEMRKQALFAGDMLEWLSQLHFLPVC